MEAPEVLAARARVDACRRQLQETVQEARSRLAPSTIASNAIGSVKTKAGTIADDLRLRAGDGLKSASRSPITLTAVAAAVGLVLFRRPLQRLLRRSIKND